MTTGIYYSATTKPTVTFLDGSQAQDVVTFTAIKREVNGLFPLMDRLEEGWGVLVSGGVEARPEPAPREIELDRFRGLLDDIVLLAKRMDALAVAIQARAA